MENNNNSNRSSISITFDKVKNAALGILGQADKPEPETYQELKEMSKFEAEEVPQIIIDPIDEAVKSGKPDPIFIPNGVLATSIRDGMPGHFIEADGGLLLDGRTSSKDLARPIPLVKQEVPKESNNNNLPPIPPVAEPTGEGHRGVQPCTKCKKPTTSHTTEEHGKCKRCGSDKHLIKNCKEKLCYRCGGAGHKQNQCRETKCKACGSDKHLFRSCPVRSKSSKKVNPVATQLLHEVQQKQGEIDGLKDIIKDPSDFGRSGQPDSNLREFPKYKYKDAYDQSKEIAKLKEKIASMEEEIDEAHGVLNYRETEAVIDKIRSMKGNYIKYSTWEYDSWHMSASYKIFGTPWGLIFFVVFIFLALSLLTIPLSLLSQPWGLGCIIQGILMAIFGTGLIVLIVLLIDLFRCVVLRLPSWFGQGDLSELWITDVMDPAEEPHESDLRTDRQKLQVMKHHNPFYARIKYRRTINWWVQKNFESIVSLELVAQACHLDYLPLNFTPIQAADAICSVVGHETSVNVDRYSMLMGNTPEAGACLLAYALWMQQQNLFSNADFLPGHRQKI